MSSLKVMATENLALLAEE